MIKMLRSSIIIKSIAHQHFPLLVFSNAIVVGENLLQAIDFKNISECPQSLSDAIVPVIFSNLQRRVEEST